MARAATEIKRRKKNRSLGCENKARARRGLAPVGLNELETLTLRRQKKGKGCKIQGCIRKHHAKGFCRTHYGQSRRKKG